MKFTAQKCFIIDATIINIILTNSKIHQHLYCMNFQAISQCSKANFSEAAKPSKLWHARFGHAHYSRISQLIHKRLAIGIPIGLLPRKSTLCEVYVTGKQTRTTFSKQTTPRTTLPLQFVMAAYAARFASFFFPAQGIFCHLLTTFQERFGCSSSKGNQTHSRHSKSFNERPNTPPDTRYNIFAPTGVENSHPSNSLSIFEGRESTGISLAYSPQQNGIVE